MRLFLSLCCVLLMLTESLQAQTEMVIPWSDTFDVSQDAHLADKEGSLYILGHRNLFYSGPGALIDGQTFAGTVMLKLDKYNKLLWRHIYPVDISQTSAPDMVAKHFYLTDSTLSVPYSKYVPNTDCPFRGDPSYGPNSNGEMTISSTTGKLINDRLFLTEDTCSGHQLCLAIKENDGSSIFISTANMGNVVYLNRWDKRSHNISRDTLQGNQALNPDRYFYDSFAMNFLSRPDNEDGLIIYDRNLHFIKMLQLPDSIHKHTRNPIVGCSRKYYALNINSVRRNKSVFTYTAIYDRNGTLVSIGRTPSFKQIIITDDGDLFGIREYPCHLSSPHITFTQMDIGLKVIREQQLGEKYIKDCILSLTDNKEVIITGTKVAGKEDKTPRRPDCIYVYRTPLESIPLISH